MFYKLIAKNDPIHSNPKAMFRWFLVFVCSEKHEGCDVIGCDGCKWSEDTGRTAHHLCTHYR